MDVSEATERGGLQALEVFVGTWSMILGFAPSPADAPRARTTWEWLAGRRFLIQRWEVDHPDAPDGIAVIGSDGSESAYAQHYFDSRGVVRIYDMSLAGPVWMLERIAAERDFSQRFTGTFSEDRNTISGRWERSDDGKTWTHDFDLNYVRIG